MADVDSGTDPPTPLLETAMAELNVVSSGSNCILSVRLQQTVYSASYTINHTVSWWVQRQHAMLVIYNMQTRGGWPHFKQMAE